MPISNAELLKSGYIHYPLPLHKEHSLEAELLQSKVLKEQKIESFDSLSNLHTIGECYLAAASHVTPNGQNCISFQAPSAFDKRPNGRLEEGDCSNYGSFGVSLDIPSQNWESFNRISFYIKAECEGVRHMAVTLCFNNSGEITIPDIYHREGYHVINLSNDDWNEISLDIDTLPRDCITGISFQSRMVGCETDSDLGNILSFVIGDLKLQKVNETENALGWNLPLGKTAYSYSGYMPEAAKTAIAGLPAGSRFDILNEEGVSVFTGSTMEFPQYPNISVLEFSNLSEPGTYRIRTDSEESQAFIISEDAYVSSIWKSINFLFCQRCGYPVPTYHQSCHRDILASHKGKKFNCNGGWHDAGDVSQQLIQSAEITYALFEAADAYKQEEPLYLRLREEGLWGLDYILKSRFGDGYRATSVGVSMWTRGFIGDADDITSRAHNNAYDNFLCAAVEAYCSMKLLEEDRLFAERLITCARADFSFAMERFQETGYNEYPPEYWEHSHMTSPSLFAATISWSASILYQATNKKEYADIAAEYGDYVVTCQEFPSDAIKNRDFPAYGFFYRSHEKKSLQHFNHQARDQVYMQALTELCNTQPEHPSMSKWSASIQAYGNYLKALMEHGNPYGMMPSGLYRKEEIHDKEAFARQHLQTGDEVYEHYEQQLEHGVNIGDGYYLKQFPVWFSFRGNNAVILSMGKSASLCGKFLNDKKLLDIALHQLEWNLGKNPFRQSLMYGEGHRYAQQYAVMPGEITGELPVGVQTLSNGDEPYWPQMNNATYKEVWTTPTARWLSIAADLPFITIR